MRLELHIPVYIHCDDFKKFEGLIFVDNKLPAKTTKITSLGNLYVYDIQYYSETALQMHVTLCSSCTCTHA